MDVKKLLGRYSHVEVDSPDRLKLSDSERECLGTIIKAAMLVDKLWSRQMWDSSEQFYFLVGQHISPESDLFKYITLDKGPWSSLDEGKCFIPQNSEVSMYIPETPPAGNIL